jgi:NAD dependent epimerase/dehydratase family enzyme
VRTGPETLFVEQVGHAWEAGTAPAERAGIRVVRLRIGIVLTPAGGALAQMLPPFMAGVGGRLGNGRQYMSWIASTTSSE